MHGTTDDHGEKIRKETIKIESVRRRRAQLHYLVEHTFLA
jgi:hypothetical protein